MKTKILNYAIINKYPMICFVVGILSIGLGMYQNIEKTELLGMVIIFGGLTFFTSIGIYYTRYVVVKNILNILDKKQIPAHLLDAHYILFSYKEDDYKINLYTSRGTTFMLWYKNEKLIANKICSTINLVRMLSLIDSEKTLVAKKYKHKVKSLWL
ncbi:hypothetical protein [Bernardetia sp.]|uniref:hypothetical protein n=1 Tax=Bernardetia sp. TaxID=1937974 RepID=UPI0025BC58E5|nr:hypothetical protein [Bernardetia sp.]